MSVSPPLSYEKQKECRAGDVHGELRLLWTLILGVPCLSLRVTQLLVEACRPPAPVWAPCPDGALPGRGNSTHRVCNQSPLGCSEVRGRVPGVSWRPRNVWFSSITSAAGTGSCLHGVCSGQVTRHGAHGRTSHRQHRVVIQYVQACGRVCSGVSHSLHED